MDYEIEDRVVGFYYDLFEALFMAGFRGKIPGRFKRDNVDRQVQECAAAASQALVRLLAGEQLTPAAVDQILSALGPLGGSLPRDDTANPNVPVERVTEELLAKLPCPQPLARAGRGAVYRIALSVAVQGVKLVAPVMHEWEKVNFSTTFELPRRVTQQLNRIGEQIERQRPGVKAADDERYELQYRDYLLQRFFQVEVGTVRMTTNQGVDLRQLFVMPKVLRRRPPQRRDAEGAPGEEALMDLAAARRVFGERGGPKERKRHKPLDALDQIQSSSRTVIVGAPGSGKSTFLEWLQLQVASIEEAFVLADHQAIPLLLRVRELDARRLPVGAQLIREATRSEDRAEIMPEGWVHRQMAAGRVLFMLDGLDEVDPQDRDRRLIPWLVDLVRKYPDCQYVVSSRPVGYPAGMLGELDFAECDLLDFGPDQVAAFTRNWCTAVRLAQNEPEAEAQREGAREGDQIAAGFRGHPYIRDLARNPLMLSAICLVNYFEKGRLPEDRALLYKLCVEGLLHFWDERRGIHSEFGLEEKVRACREVAIAMQADDRAECQAADVLVTFTEALGDAGRAGRLLEHIRYRTGLLLERRAGVFAFTHLTFQEYLAARAVHEGNRKGITPQHLPGQHADARWQEVMPLYCGLAPAPAAREMIEKLMAQADTRALASVLAEAFLSSGEEVTRDAALRERVVRRDAVAPYPRMGENPLDRFAEKEAAPAAHSAVGTGGEGMATCAYRWLFDRPGAINWGVVLRRLQPRDAVVSAAGLCELVVLAHRHGPDHVLEALAADERLYAAPGPRFRQIEYASQAEVALLALGWRAPDRRSGAIGSPPVDQALLQILRTLDQAEFFPSSYPVGEMLQGSIEQFIEAGPGRFPKDRSTWPEYIRLARSLAGKPPPPGRGTKGEKEDHSAIVELLAEWADALERALRQHPGGGDA